MFFKRFSGWGRRKEFETASEIYKTVSDVWADRAKTPIVSMDDGRGETLENYYVEEVRVRIGIRIGIDETGEGFYKINEPPLPPEDELIYAYALKSLYHEVELEELQAKETEELLRERVKAVAEELGAPLDAAAENRITYYLNREVFGYGPIHALTLDEELERIKCISVKEFVIVRHRRYGNLGWLKTNVRFGDEDRLIGFIRRLAHKGGRGISFAIPYVDCQLYSPTGTSMRFTATLGRRMSKTGSSFSIKMFQPMSIRKLIDLKMLSPLMAAYLWYVCESKRAFFIAGPEDSGKTTLLNAILSILDHRSSYVTIEDFNELQLPERRWKSVSVRRNWALVDPRYELGIEDVVEKEIEERPDYLVVGEVREPKQLISLVSATMGHGFMTSICVKNPENFLARLTTMEIPGDVPDVLWGCAIIQRARGKPGPYQVTKRVTKIVEFIPRPKGGVEAAEVFAWNPDRNEFYPDSLNGLWERSKRLQKLSDELKIPKDEILDDIRRRIFLLKEMPKDFEAASKKAAELYSEKALSEARMLEVAWLLPIDASELEEGMPTIIELKNYDILLPSGVLDENVIKVVGGRAEIYPEPKRKGVREEEIEECYIRFLEKDARSGKVSILKLIESGRPGAENIYVKRVARILYELYARLGRPRGRVVIIVSSYNQLGYPAKELRDELSSHTVPYRVINFEIEEEEILRALRFVKIKNPELLVSLAKGFPKLIGHLRRGASIGEAIRRELGGNKNFHFIAKAAEKVVELNRPLTTSEAIKITGSRGGSASLRLEILRSLDLVQKTSAD